MSNNFVKIINRFSAEPVAASASLISEKINLMDLAQYGFFSLQLTVTGDGMAKVEYLCSNNGSDFIKPVGADDIVSGFTKTSGPGSDGKGFYSFAPETCGWMKIKVTETGTAAAIAVTLDIAIQ
jgi:hypothetical protein